MLLFYSQSNIERHPSGVSVWRMSSILELVDAQFGQFTTVNSTLDAELEKYFENPYLLDQFLEAIVRKLTFIYLKDRAITWPLNSLYILCNVRGFKQVAKFLDTDPQLLDSTVKHITTQTLDWRSRYILLLWISTLLLLPFDLDALGNNLFETIFDLCTKDLLRSSKERDSAALAMAKLLSRSNQKENTRRFLDWQAGGIGTLQVLAHLSRNKVYYPDEFLQLAATAQGDTELKLAIKIRTRVSLQHPQSDTTEDTVNFLFETISNPSTSLRYSSAKALARICKKLGEIGQKEMGEEIVSEIFHGFQDDQIKGRDRLSLVSDEKWHGSLLFIAELLRQKVGLDHTRLSAVLDDALHFEQKRVSCSVGANVRDAGCYVCWAVFKYRRELDEPFLHYCYSSLIGLACFDREVNVRRAAAAALQEGLGRHHGMETSKMLQLIEALNFQSVGPVSKCYLEIAPSLEPSPHLRYLVHHGVCSWDVNMRRLAAKGLELFPSPPIDELFDLFNVPDQDTRHGVLCALGAVYRGPQEPLQKILSYEFDYSSELVCEGVLAFLKCVASPADYMQRCMWASGEPVLERIKELIPLLKEDLSKRWLENVEESPAYVVAIAEYNRELLLKITNVKDPKSRKIVIENLERSPDAELAIEAALDDYQCDSRGDVGSWVRMAAIDKVREWKLFTKNTLNSLWRMASETLDRLRLMSCDCLELHGVSLIRDSPAKYFNALMVQASPKLIVHGVVTCIGGRSGNLEAANGALYALINNLEQLAPYIMELGWKSDLGLNTLRTVVKTLELGYCDMYDQRQLLRLGYNATVNTREIPRIMAGMQILGFINDDRGLERLVKLCGNPFSSIRVRASEILFEKGYQMPLLLKTDWGGKGCGAKVEELLAQILPRKTSLK